MLARFCPEGVEPAILGLFWDIGANVGCYTWLTKSMAPKAEARMYEPDPDNVWLVEQTLRRAALTGIVLRDVAVSDGRGAKRFERDMIAGSTGNLGDGGDTFSLATLACCHGASHRDRRNGG
jgi:FkbM family methyltransferase